MAMGGNVARPLAAFGETPAPWAPGERPRPLISPMAAPFDQKCPKHERMEQCVVCAYFLGEHPDDHEPVPVESCYRCGKVLSPVNLRCTCRACESRR